ncbi:MULTISPECIES: FUSC family protein [unclassified Curtobacterium]|uniref:FUSC family protein n=1 Tax=unclassified Curtobacterium TaxID=257496 RepID=UPI00226B0394|nr:MULTISPECIES: FUSC family protein [unclassified Curtobacterium]
MRDAVVDSTQRVRLDQRLLRRVPVSARRRALRVAVVAPTAFAVARGFLPADVALFAAFGSIMQIVFVDFSGPARLRRTIGVAVATSALIAVGTALSSSAVSATVGVGLLAFAIAFAGVVSSSVALATPVLLFALALAATVPAGVDAVLPRLAAWGVAAVLVVAAKAFVLPTATDDPLRDQTRDALLGLMLRLRTRRAAPQVQTLRESFSTQPRRPEGFRPGGRRLLVVINAVLAVDDAVTATGESDETVVDDAERTAIGAALHVVRLRLQGTDVTSALLDVRARLEDLREQRELRYLGDRAAKAWPAHQLLQRTIALVEAASGGGGRAHRYVSDTLRSHWSWRSAWLRNSVRTGATLAVSITAANLVGAEHAFWVAFGTLAVLRTNAVGTARSAWQAVLGTVVGVVVAELVLLLTPHAGWITWVVVPVALAVMAFSPEVFPFLVGQAAFSTAILGLFALAAPQQPTIGLIRLGDVLLGASVSAVLGWLLWPSGVVTAFRADLAAAYEASADYVVEVVSAAASAADRGSALTARRSAVAAGRRLDDAFREFLLEHRSTAASPVASIRLVAAPSEAREAADAILDLGSHLRQEHHLDPSPAQASALTAAAERYRGQVRALARGIRLGATAEQTTTAPAVDEQPRVPRSADPAAAFSVWACAQVEALEQTARDVLPTAARLSRSSPPARRRP